MSKMADEMPIQMPPGYLSTTAYCFTEEQADAIVQISAYHRRDFDLSVIWFSPREHLNVYPLIATSFQRTSNIGLGALELLSIELLYDVILHLDIDSLFKFRQINRRSRQIVNSLREYQLVVSYGLNLFCALLRTKISTKVSLFDFYSALCTKACAICGEFSGFISLVTWRRCCFRCLRQAPEIQMQSLATIRRQFHLTKAMSNRLSSFKTLPGTYSMEESEYKSRVTIVSVYQAISLFRREPDELAEGQQRGTGRSAKFKYMGSCALPYYDKKSGRVEHGVSCAGCELAIEKEIIGEGYESWAYEARNKVYSQDGFLEHFQWCEQAQLLWKSSGEGTTRPIELPVAVTEGGYFDIRE